MNSTVTEVFHLAAASSLSLAVNTVWMLCNVGDEFWPGLKLSEGCAKFGTDF